MMLFLRQRRPGKPQVTGSDDRLHGSPFVSMNSSTEAKRTKQNAELQHRFLQKTGG
jgi:hypothetical protein